MNAKPVPLTYGPAVDSGLGVGRVMWNSAPPRIHACAGCGVNQSSSGPTLRTPPSMKRHTARRLDHLFHDATREHCEQEFLVIDNVPMTEQQYAASKRTQLLHSGAGREFLPAPRALDTLKVKRRTSAGGIDFPLFPIPQRCTELLGAVPISGLLPYSVRLA
jgi:hypothetical protein